jgi:maleate isomerase
MMVKNDFCRFAIGLLIPATNVVMESEFHRMAPEGVEVLTTRVLHKGRKPSDTFYESLRRLVDDIPAAVIRVKQVNPDVIIFGCTSGSFLEGADWNKAIIQKMRRIGNTLATTTSSAVAEALKVMQLTHIAVGTPYPDAVNQKLMKYLSAMGIRITRIASVSYEQIQSEFAARRLVESLDGADIDGIFISCTDFRTIHVLDQLEKELGKPVISSNQASLWSCLRLGGAKDKVETCSTMQEEK